MKQFTNHTKKFLVLFALLLLPFLLLTNIPQAEALNCSLRKDSPPNWVFINGQWIRAHGQMCAGQSGNNGDCTIRTYTNPSTNVNYVGWTTWQCDLLLGSTIIDSESFLGDWELNYWTKSTGLSYTNAYSNGHTVAVSGRHDANHNGASSSPWQANNNANYP